MGGRFEKQMAKEPRTVSPPPGLRLWAGRQRNANCARSERQSLHPPVSLLPGTPCLLQDGMGVPRARSPVPPQNARLIGARLCTDICPRLISRKWSFKKRNAHNCDFSSGSHRGTCVKVQNALEKDARCKSTVLGSRGQSELRYNERSMLFKMKSESYLLQENADFLPLPPPQGCTRPRKFPILWKS